MKKVTIAVIAAALAVLALAGCSKKEFVDGTYRAEDMNFDRGYKEFVEVTVSGGKISKVVADAVKEDGVSLKTKDEDYKKNYEGTGNDSVPEVFYPSLEAQLQKTGDPAKVEVVAGATNSSEKFKKLSTAALERAKIGDSTTAVLENKVSEE